MYGLCWGWEWCGGAKGYRLDGDYKASDSPIGFETIEEVIEHLLKPKNISKLYKVISRRSSGQNCELFVEDIAATRPPGGFSAWEINRRFERTDLELRNQRMGRTERWRFTELLGGQMGHHAMEYWDTCLASGDATEFKSLKLEYEMKKNADALLADFDARLARSSR